MGVLIGLWISVRNSEKQGIDRELAWNLGILVVLCGIVGAKILYIIKLAEYVDSKMRAVAEQTHTVDTARLAVLAALNIADEYHLLKRNGDTGASEYLQRAHHLSRALDEVLEDKRRTG